MECNKDEAIRTQKIAEKKFKDRDFSGAKNSALKAQNLYPTLEGLSQMLSTFDVHIAAENRVSGEMDWYGILGITPTADDDTVRKQYRKLAILLHPNINKSVGADGALKFITEAWTLLSDKAKRLAYNERTNTQGFQQRVLTQPRRPYSVSNSNGVGNSTNGGGNSADDGESEVPVLSMDVPDPHFYNFGQDTSEMSFEDNQIWAAYDGDDCMPRLYAFVQKLISTNPFKLRIGLLASKGNSEFGSMEWVSSGFAKSCGEFRIGKYEVSKSLTSFSHKVKWTECACGLIQIIPQKGDIWALYRNWSSYWNEHTPDEVIHKYDMVEVLDDCNKEKGVPVIPLVKVAGFRTVFRPHHSKIMTIPKEEMFRFSHQVPNYVLTGQEGQNAPKGYQELDPAATPLELLQVINEI